MKFCRSNNFDRKCSTKFSMQFLSSVEYVCMLRVFSVLFLHYTSCSSSFISKSFLSNSVDMVKNLSPYHKFVGPKHVFTVEYALVVHENAHSCYHSKVSFTHRCTSKWSHSRNLTSLFPLIFLSKHISLHALGRS